MRVILKPAGLVIILVAFASLTAMLMWSRKSANTATAAPAENQNPTPRVPSAPPATGGATPSATPIVEASATPGDWRKILEPDIASANWRGLFNGVEASSEVVDATVPGHPKARRVTMPKIGKNPWDVQIAHPLNAAFQKGWHLRLSFWARSKNSCPVAAVVEQATEPYTKVIFRKIDIGPQWKQYTQEWVQSDTTPSGWAHVDFQTGYKAGEVEITGVRIEVIGRNKPARP